MISQGTPSVTIFLVLSTLNCTKLVSKLSATGNYVWEHLVLWSLYTVCKCKVLQPSCLIKTVYANTVIYEIISINNNNGGIIIFVMVYLQSTSVLCSLVH